jgi:hypothetical protein
MEPSASNDAARWTASILAAWISAWVLAMAALSA